MKRMYFATLAGVFATATMALVMGDASAQYRDGTVGLAVHDGVYSNGMTNGMYRRTARRAYRRAAYTGVIGSGVGYDSANNWGRAGWGASAPALAVGVAATSNAAGYGAYGSYANNYGSFNAGTYRRTGEAYYHASPAVTRLAARRVALLSSDAAAGWAAYPTRAEFVRGYATPGYGGYYGPQCNPVVDVGCY